ncbi:MAG: tellurite resistance TerB family protein [Sedimentisphaerales bacterium]|nr:tellurite resistance TerB family protein [Sedimentisphaerales bacterium]
MSILIGVAAAITMILFSLIRRVNVAELINRLTSGDFIGHLSISDLLNNFKVTVSPQKTSRPSIELSHELDLSILNCRAKLSQQEDDDGIYDAFEVEICGSIHARQDVESANLSISIEDTTDKEPKTHSVQAVVKQWQEPDSSVFRYNAKLGKLPHQVTTISEWTSIAIFRLDWLVLPHKGKRELMFIISIFPAEGGEQLACARCYLEYHNREFGYLDLKENNQRSKTLAVALAFTVSAADGKMYDCEIELIKNWSRENIDLSETSSKERRKLEKALKETITFFQEGNKLNSHDICREIVEIAPPADRESILNLCLHVAQANGSVTSEELTLLKDLASWLEIDTDKFREMVQKVFPVDMYEVMDIETILGVTSDMNKEKARRRLNKEYSKWSARVTNADPDIQSQADQMLQLIADARSQYIG